MEYRPYIWLGEDQDAHIQDYRSIQTQAMARSAYLLAAMSYESGMQLAQQQVITGFYNQSSPQIGTFSGSLFQAMGDLL